MRAGGIVPSRGEGEGNFSKGDDGGSDSDSYSESTPEGYGEDEHPRSRDGGDGPEGDPEDSPRGSCDERMESEAAKDDQEIEVEVEVEVDDEEEPELAVDEIGGDYWWEDEQNGLLWIEHRVPRRTMVQPGGPGCPYRGDEFEDGRWTKIDQDHPSGHHGFAGRLGDM